MTHSTISKKSAALNRTDENIDSLAISKINELMFEGTLDDFKAPFSSDSSYNVFDCKGNHVCKMHSMRSTSDLIESLNIIKESSLEIGSRVEISATEDHESDTGIISKISDDGELLTVKLHSGDVRQFNKKDVKLDSDEESSQESSEDTFYVALQSEDDGESFVGMISKSDGRWKEYSAVGNPDSRWGSTYMSYLTVDQVMSYVTKDYLRFFEVSGPFNTKQEALDDLESNGVSLDENISEDVSDDVLEFLTKAYNEMAKSAAYSVEAKKELREIYNDLRSALMKSDVARFKQVSNRHHSKSPDLADELYDSFYKNAGVKDINALVSKFKMNEEILKIASSFMDKALKKISEATAYTDINDWKEAVKNSHPVHAKKIQFMSRMQGRKMTVSAEIPGLDRCFGVWDLEDEKGEVLSEKQNNLNRK